MQLCSFGLCDLRHPVHWISQCFSNVIFVHVHIEISFDHDQYPPFLSVSKHQLYIQFDHAAIYILGCVANADFSLLFLYLLHVLCI
jgi:hypothetical protein